MTLTPTLVDDTARQTALLKAVGLDRLSPEQRELALNIAQRYELDLLLKHLVMIEGRAYITRDGLLHIAHRSGYFDGMETTEPVLVDGFWKSTCSIFRKDMTRPFTYTGRYPEAGRNRQYAPEMSIKVGEVMALRRAFDVSAPAYEERWAGDGDPDVEPEPPKPLTALVAERAQAITHQDGTEVFTGRADQVAARSSESTSATVEQMTSPPVVRPTRDRAEARRARRQAAAAQAEAADVQPQVAQPSPSVLQAEPDDLPAEAEPGMSLADFAQAVVDFDRDALRALAKSTFPDARSFGALSDAQRLRLYDVAVAQLGTDDDDEDDDEAEVFGGPMPVEASAAVAYDVADEACGKESPWTAGVLCDRPAGHAGAHQSGANESW